MSAKSWVLALTGVACAVGACGVTVPEGGAVLNPAQVKRHRDNAAALQRCQRQAQERERQRTRALAELAVAKARSASLAARLGLTPLTTSSLHRPDAKWRLSLPKMQLLTARDAKGKRVGLGQGLKKAPATVVGYWATWCKPCTTPGEIAHMRHLREELARYSAHFVSVAADPAPQVLEDPRSATWLYPIYALDKAHVQSLPEAMIRAGVGLPLFVVVDKQGQIRWVRKGKLDDAVVEDLVSAAARVARGID